jgi:phenylpropionate dioxygenase-like ring-hydroxylating dioxygenase large terminal subunit
MRNEVCQPIVRTLFDHLESRSSWRVESTSAIPAANYSDPAHLAVEKERLFRRLPQVVALSSELSEPGSYITRDPLGLPVVVTRTRGGVLEALVNVCAHRGAQVVRGAGCSRRLTCPYHSWSYDHDGTLVAVPDASAFPEVVVPGPGMARLPVVEESGLVWIIPDPTAEPDDPGLGVADGLGAVADDLDNFGLDTMAHWATHRFELDLNWKLVIDTFLEPYHFASLHRNTVGPFFMANLCVAERFGSHVREVLPRKTLTELTDVPPEEWDLVPHSAMVYVLAPNTVFVMQLDHVETWRVYPNGDDPAKCICDLDFYIQRDSEASERHWERNWNLTIDTVIDEDFAAMAGAQRGFSTGVLEHLTVGTNEPALGMFHESLADALALEEPIP